MHNIQTPMAPVTPRIAPLSAPYAPDIAAAFERVMPPGMAPLELFRTMARSPRVLQRIFAGNFLDKGSISLREREILILRTCARCASEYEWGVHVSLFARRAGLSEQEVAATLDYPMKEDDWAEAELLLLALADTLHDKANVDDALWTKLARHYTQEQLLEMIAVVGCYHTISFMTNALAIKNEDFAARFAR
jgi:alkylhydroperoxidase family enzyme